MNCLNCQKETKNPSFCCRSCSTSFNNKKYPKRKIVRKCSKCNNTVRNYRSSLCEEHFKKHKKTYRKNLENQTLKELRENYSHLHASSRTAKIRCYARSWFKELTKQPCQNCGYDKHVELCHIKPVKDFCDNDIIGDINSRNNIVQLCPNCHWEFDNGLLKLAPSEGIEPTDFLPTV